MPPDDLRLRTLIPALAIAAAVWAGPGCDGDAPTAPDSSEPRAVHFDMLALGDSYTLGQGIPAPSSWPQQLADSLSVHGDTLHIDMIAETGWTTDDLLEEVSSRSLDNAYDLVTVMIGVNDQFRDRRVDDFDANLGVLIEAAIASAGGLAERVVVFSIPDYGVTPYGEMFGGAAVSADIDVFNSAAASTAGDHGVLWCDITTASRTAAVESGLVARDGMHFSASMYARWVHIALPALRSCLAYESAETPP